jgi:pimeloyl-ACP methyl ester carboxylesterase
VRRLVLAATNCGIGAFPGWLPAVMSLATPLRYYSPSFFDRTAAATNGGVTGRDQSVRQRMINARRSHPPSADGYMLQLLGIFGWSSWHFLPFIPHETLVINGDDDPLVPVANAEMLAERIQNATLEIVPGAGHLLLWDDAENLGRRISSFLNPERTRRASGSARPARTRRRYQRTVSRATL